MNCDLGTRLVPSGRAALPRPYTDFDATLEARVRERGDVVFSDRAGDFAAAAAMAQRAIQPPAGAVGSGDGDFGGGRSVSGRESFSDVVQAGVACIYRVDFSLHGVRRRMA